MKSSALKRLAADAMFGTEATLKVCTRLSVKFQDCLDMLGFFALINPER